MYRAAKVIVTGAEARTVDKNTITRGMTGAVVEFEYRDPMWDDLTKYVEFEGYSEPICFPSDDTTVVLPWEVTTQVGSMVKVGVYGTDAMGTVVIPTIWAELGTVRGSPGGNGNPPGQPTPTIWAQLMEEIEALKKRIPEFGKEDAGKMLYISADGSLVPLELGRGLRIVNGVLMLDTGSGTPTTVEATLVDGLLVLMDSNGATITPELSAEGLLTWPGVTTDVDENGYFTFS